MPAPLKRSTKLVAAENPSLNALQTKLRQLALEALTRNSIPVSEEDDRVKSAAMIAQAEIFVAIEEERRRHLPVRHERLQEIRAWKFGKGDKIDIDLAARLVRVQSLRSRRHSEEKAIEASKGIKFQDLPSVERRAAEIVVGRRRAAKNNPTEPASLIADQVRSEWIAKGPSVRRLKGKGVSIFSIVRIAVPILDRLAGKPIRSGMPTSRDPLSMKPGMGALYAIVLNLGHAEDSFEHVYKSLLDFRRTETMAS